MLEPTHNLPWLLTDTVSPALYSELKAEVMAAVVTADRMALTCDAWTSVATESDLLFY